MKEDSFDISSFKNRVINLIFSIGYFVVLVALVAVFFRDIGHGLDLSFYIQLLIVLLTGLIVYYRKKLGLKVKVYFIIFALLSILISSLFSNGFLASAKAYMILAPVLIAFTLDYKKAFAWLLIYLTVYLIFGFLYTQAYLPADIDVNDYIFEMKVWITDAAIIFFSAFCLLYVGSNYQSEIFGKLKHIQEQQETLVKSEEKYKKLVLAYPDMIMVSDLKGNIIFANDNLLRITGITEEEFDKLDRKPHVHPDDKSYVLKTMNRLVNSDETQSEIIENRYIDAWGKEHWFSGTFTKLFIDGEMFIQTVSRDITQRKKNELELDHYRKNLEKLVKEKTLDLESANDELKATLQDLKAKQAQLLQSEKMASLGTLTAGVAHEINNPLNYIMGAHVGLESYFEKVTSSEEEKTAFFLSSIKTGIDRIVNIIEGLDQFSKEDSSIDDDCDLHQIIDNCLLMLNHQIMHKVNVVKDFSSEPIALKGNSGKFLQVFVNLLLNAIQAIENEGEIKITTSRDEHTIRLEIQDNGCGISEKDLPQITDPFFTTKDPGKGTGLGLSITYSIIKEHKGHLDFLSEIGKGTSVILSFPV